MIRHAYIWTIAALTLALSGAGWLIGIVVGLFVAGIVSGYLRGRAIVMSYPALRPLEEDEDE